MKKIYNFLTELSRFTGGVQKVFMDINQALEDYEIITLSNTKYDDLYNEFIIPKERYLHFSFSNLFKLENSIIITHERRVVVFLGLIRLLTRLNFKIVYVHHNEMHSYKQIPFPADSVVSISDSGYNNLVNDLGVNPNRITKIYNTVKCKQTNRFTHCYNPNLIRILLPATIYAVKQQVELVRMLKSKINDNIKIDFAGCGPDINLLIKEIGSSKNFEFIGFQKEIPSILYRYDYVLLYSKHEGLPISLIEGAMCGLPMITNRVGGCPEIVREGQNGFIVDNYDELIETLNSLNSISNEKWIELSNNSKRIFEQNFSFEIFKANYLTLINKLML